MASAPDEQASPELIVCRYTLTYTPSHDRILPTPPYLHVKIRNTSAIALRAAYLHGPYTLYAACFPAAFDPDTKDPKQEEHGEPHFEPNLRAGGQWQATLKVPENIREQAGKANLRRNLDGTTPTAKWIIEISSQVLFSNTAAVHYEITVGRDEKSVNLGFAANLVGSQQHSVPGKLADHQQGRRRKGKAAQPHGIYSQALDLLVEDTATLWDQPPLLTDKDKEEEIPERRARHEQAHAPQSDKKDTDDSKEAGGRKSGEANAKRPQRKKRKIHLVILTHGLHSNLGADMLYLKESIDKAAEKARAERKERKAEARKASKASKTKKDAGGTEDNTEVSTESAGTGDETHSTEHEKEEEEGDEEEDEEVLVRGFGNNAVRTERGIIYLGKRLARYVLGLTYPDQPYIPMKKQKSLSRVFTGQQQQQQDTENGQGQAAHGKSTIRKEEIESQRPFQITSISFIGHSLGGLTQMYAIAYIHKHAPGFFDRIKPINFVALASPLLGLSNENPLYVKFALDFGLVGRTGQDLGLTWRPPTMVRGGWEAMIGGIGAEGQRKQRQVEPGSKPLLRVLPAGPAHEVLKMFRNRTIYSNVVNDGIVPLRTSCLLFLDWRSLGQVEKARRQNGFVGTMAGWGWAEMTGTNSSSRPSPRGSWFSGDASEEGDEDATSGANTPTRQGDGDAVPLPSENATREDNGGPRSPEAKDPHPSQMLSNKGKQLQEEGSDKDKASQQTQKPPLSPLAGFLSLLKPGGGSSDKNPSPRLKQNRAYTRGQTLKIDTAKEDGNSDTGSKNIPSGPHILSASPGENTDGSKVLGTQEDLFTPPKTTFFEAAGDLLNPPLPPMDFLIDPSSRPRTIFHDRVYHPEDIPPPPPTKIRSTLLRTFSSEGGKDLKSPTSTAASSSRNSTISSTESDMSGSTIYGGSGGGDNNNNNNTNSSNMKVEEKIARAYHRDISWRKVLVRLEPDAHNNMIVRRMFSNAYGWPVVKHLVDTHFADTYAANTSDVFEPSVERAGDIDEQVREDGVEVKGQQDVHGPEETRESASAKERAEEKREASDQVGELVGPTASTTSTGSGSNPSLATRNSSNSNRPIFARVDSAQWDDRFFEGSEDEEEEDDDDDNNISMYAQHAPPHTRHQRSNSARSVKDEELERWQSDPKSITTERLARPLVVPVLANREQGDEGLGGISGIGLRRSLEERLRMPLWGAGEDGAKGSLAMGTASIKRETGGGGGGGTSGGGDTGAATGTGATGSNAESRKE